MYDPVYDAPMTQERRERFWRQYGWRPDLPEAQRTEIEQRWSDPDIQEAEAFGF